MVTGRGLGPLKYILRADANGREAYAKMLDADSFQNPITYDEAEKGEFDALVLPGGHDKNVKPYLESPIVQQIVSDFMNANKPVGAICHGVLVLARTKGNDGRSILHGRKVTSLLNRLETPAYLATRLWMGDYYRTYPGITTEDEVRSVLATPDDFSTGSMGAKRDSLDALHTGFVVRDENLITARWPGDTHRWSLAIQVGGFRIVASSESSRTVLIRLNGPQIDLAWVQTLTTKPYFIDSNPTITSVEVTVHDGAGDITMSPFRAGQAVK